MVPRNGSWGNALAQPKAHLFHCHSRSRRGREKHVYFGVCRGDVVLAGLWLNLSHELLDQLTSSKLWEDLIKRRVRKDMHTACTQHAACGTWHANGLRTCLTLTWSSHYDQKGLPVWHVPMGRPLRTPCLHRRKGLTYLWDDLLTWTFISSSKQITHVAQSLFKEYILPCARRDFSLRPISRGR